MLKLISVVTICSLLAACGGSQATRTTSSGASSSNTDAAKVNCVAKHGQLVPKRGGGWWCKRNGKLFPLSDFI